MQPAHEADAKLITGDDEIQAVAARAGVKLDWIGPRRRVQSN